MQKVPWLPWIHSTKLVFYSEDVLAGSPSRGWDVKVYAFDINQLSLPAAFCSVLVSFSVFMALSTVFHSRNSLDNSALSDSVLPVLFLPYWPFQLYLLVKSLLQP